MTNTILVLKVEQMILWHKGSDGDKQQAAVEMGRKWWDKGVQAASREEVTLSQIVKEDSGFVGEEVSKGLPH